MRAGFDLLCQIETMVSEGRFRNRCKGYNCFARAGLTTLHILFPEKQAVEKSSWHTHSKRGKHHIATIRFRLKVGTMTGAGVLFCPDIFSGSTCSRISRTARFLWYSKKQKAGILIPAFCFACYEKKLISRVLVGRYLGRIQGGAIGIGQLHQEGIGPGPESVGLLHLSFAVAILAVAVI